MGTKRVALAVAVVLLAVVPAVPAYADEDGVCTGWGTKSTAAPIRYAKFAPTTPTETAWGFAFTIGTCVTTGFDLTWFAAAGSFRGWCDLSTGVGITSSGHRFAWIGIGWRLLLTGEVVGEAPFFPNTLGGESCVTGASHFLVGHGATLLWNCRFMKTKGTDPSPLGFPFERKTCI